MPDLDRSDVARGHDTGIGFGGRRRLSCRLEQASRIKSRAAQDRRIGSHAIAFAIVLAADRFVET